MFQSSEVRNGEEDEREVRGRMRIKILIQHPTEGSPSEYVRAHYMFSLPRAPLQP